MEPLLDLHMEVKEKRRVKMIFEIMKGESIARCIPSLAAKA
jgi:hypothetical protein